MQEGLQRFRMKNSKKTSPGNGNSNSPSLFGRKNRQKSVDDRLSHSVWYQGGNARNTWKRPCFKGYDFVVLGDSQLKIYGKLKLLRSLVTALIRILEAM